MKTILRISLALGLFVGSVHAFSLIGPYDTWMQSTNGFRQPDDIGGPMNLGEEYRWNVPVLTYTFDASFLDYFGSNGVFAVEQAIQILNGLPPVSQIEPTNYPPISRSVNFQAATLNLLDLKSRILAALLEQMGLAQPSRFTFNVHDFGFVGGNLETQIVQRNFDPSGFFPTNRVNDSAYDYFVQVTTNGSSVSVTAEEYLIDPLATPQPAVADGALNAGEYFTSLTRDDIGGLRYLLRTNNANPEILLPGVHGVGPNAGAYVDQAIRPGVDKITFVRRDYDGFLGQFFAPYTNYFTDYYLSNNAVVAQQVERIITEPDIIFSSGNGAQDIVGAPQIFRTGTSNWWSGGILPGSIGPGIIRPPVKLMLSRPSDLVITADWLPDGSADSYRTLWGSFDGSTNPPVTFPFAVNANNLTLNLQLMRDDTVVGGKTWQIPLTGQESVVVQTSTNLVTWVPHLVFGAGRNVEWRHYIARTARYFRIVPNN